MMKILIIGSKGFIGQHLKKFLLCKDHEVWGADVVVDYVHPEKYFLVDATNADFHSIFSSVTFDVCINCSGAASVPESIQYPLRDYNLNTGNVFRLLDAIRINQPACKFINLSSAAVYGNPVLLPVAELSIPAPVSPYGIHKLMSENICLEFFRFFKIPTCSLRIFSAYGEGLKKQLFWDLYQKTKTGELISLFGTGKESRDFIYILDLVEAIYLVALHGNFNGESINIGNGQEIFIEDCVNQFYGLFDQPIRFNFIGQARKGDPNNWVADISKIKKLGYKQQHSLEKGLKNYYEWIKETDSVLE
jgi:dTDP-glucose 4,6-dehydratase/UDP-glucose 4-epimerase